MDYDFSAIPKATPKLINALKENKAITIVGSGLSVAAGYPTWKELLSGIAHDAEEVDPFSKDALIAVTNAIEQGQFLIAANRLRSKLGDQFDAILSKQFDAKVCGPTLSHAILMQLNFRAYITTNYDSLLEQILPPNKRKNTPIYSNSDENLADRILSGRPFILKLHGDFDHPKDIIISLNDYFRIQRNTNLFEALKGLFQTSYIFWIGYGHNDPDLALLMREILVKLDLSGGTALVKNDDLTILDNLNAKNISTSKFATFDDIPLYLNRLAADTDCHLRITFEIKSPLPNTADYDSIASDIKRKLSELGLEIAYVGSNELTNLYFSCDLLVFNNFFSRIENKEIVLAELFSELNVISVTLMDKKIMLGNFLTDDLIDFTNRDEEIKEITKTFPAPYYLITAPYGYGKTRLLKRIQSLLQVENFLIELQLSRKDQYSIKKIYDLLMKNLKVSVRNGRSDKPASEMGEIVGKKINQKLAENKQKKVMLVFDEIESIDDASADALLNEFIPGMVEVLNNVERSISLRIIFSGRYKSNWKRLSRIIPLKFLPLTPFDLEAVNFTVRTFNQRSRNNYNEDYIKKYSILLWYYSGGHPNCMAKILTQSHYGLAIDTIRTKESFYYDEYVKPVVEDISSNIPENLRDIFKSISPIRRFNANLLKFMITSNLIIWPEGEIDLEDRIRETYLIKPWESFLTDGIFRRLLAMKFKKDDKVSYVKICKASMSFYDSQLKIKDTFRLDIIASYPTCYFYHPSDIFYLPL